MSNGSHTVAYRARKYISAGFKFHDSHGRRVYSLAKTIRDVHRANKLLPRLIARQTTTMRSQSFSLQFLHHLLEVRSLRKEILLGGMVLSGRNKFSLR